jgi:L-alanine-DL-glutamate epimerase-like enolase superfamily enzyme
MKSKTTITALNYYPLSLPLTEPFGIASGSQARADNVLIQIRLANGINGIGEAAPFFAVSGESQKSTMSSIENLKSLVIENDVRNWINIARSLQEKERHAAAARCGIEMALLDALTKNYKMPLYVFFGGAGHRLETDMTITTGNIKHAEISAKAIVQRGISSIKVKTGGVDIDYDVKRLKAVKKTAPHSKILIDGNCGYSSETAIEFIQKLEKENIVPLLFEQPLLRDDWKGMTKISANISVPVCADESARNAEDVLKIIEGKCAKAVNIKLMKCGISEAMKMISIAESAGLSLMIGGMVESILAMSFSAHLAGGCGLFNFVDLDTPMFIKRHPFIGGFKRNKSILKLDHTKAGHGVDLKK